MNIKDEVLKKLSKYTNKKISVESTFKSLSIDSLDLLDLAIEAEKGFKIKIPDEEFLNIKKVSDFILLVEKLKSTI